jgi:hypothetical protein
MTSTHNDPIDTLTADAIRLARLGQTSEARERVDRAHRSVGAAASPARRAALTLALAYILFFEARLDEAVDTITQARDLAAAAHSTDLEAECDATLALFHTRSGKMDETVRLARRALALASKTADAVRYRAHLALATVMQVAGLPARISRWRPSCRSPGCRKPLPNIAPRVNAPDGSRMISRWPRPFIAWRWRKRSRPASNSRLGACRPRPRARPSSDCNRAWK